MKWPRQKRDVVHAEVQFRATDVKRIEPVSLEDRLVHMSKMGNVRIAWLDDGWTASIKMHVSIKGTTVEIRSNWDHKTPTEALDMLTKRVADTVKQLSQTTT